MDLEKLMKELAASDRNTKELVENWVKKDLETSQRNSGRAFSDSMDDSDDITFSMTPVVGNRGIGATDLNSSESTKFSKPVLTTKNPLVKYLLKSKATSDLKYPVNQNRASKLEISSNIESAVDNDDEEDSKLSCLSSSALKSSESKMSINRKNPSKRKRNKQKGPLNL